MPLIALYDLRRVTLPCLDMRAAAPHPHPSADVVIDCRLLLFSSGGFLVAVFSWRVSLCVSQDGSLRRKEVLDNTGDVMVLSDAAGKEIAVLEIPARYMRFTRTHGFFCLLMVVLFHSPIRCPPGSRPLEQNRFLPAPSDVWRRFSSAGQYGRCYRGVNGPPTQSSLLVCVLDGCNPTPLASSLLTPFSVCKL